MMNYAITSENVSWNAACDITVDGQYVGRIDSDGTFVESDESPITDMEDDLRDAVTELLENATEGELWPVELALFCGRQIALAMVLDGDHDDAGTFATIAEAELAMTKKEDGEYVASIGDAAYSKNWIVASGVVTPKNLHG